jgi:hypothetical protein
MGGPIAALRCVATRMDISVVSDKISLPGELALLDGQIIKELNLHDDAQLTRSL